MPVKTIPPFHIVSYVYIMAPPLVLKGIETRSGFRVCYIYVCSGPTTGKHQDFLLIEYKGVIDYCPTAIWFKQQRMRPTAKKTSLSASHKTSGKLFWLKKKGEKISPTVRIFNINIFSYIFSLILLSSRLFEGKTQFREIHYSKDLNCQLVLWWRAKKWEKRWKIEYKCHQL